MTFTVEFRGADGAVVTEVVEAASRGECFAKMKARGITPMRVEKGKGKPPARRRGGGVGRKRRVSLPWIVGVVAILALGGGLWWWFAGLEVAVPQDNGPKKPGGLVKEVTPASVAADGTETNAVVRPRILRRGERPAITPKVTENAGPLPEKPIIPNVTYGEVNGTNLWPRAIFKTREENLIVGLLRTRPGVRVIQNGFIPGEEERYRAMLAIPVRFSDDDTDEERQIKETMIAVKKELAEHVANGGKVTDVIQKERDQLNALAAYREKLRSNLFLLHKEGGNEQDTEDYLKEANRTLKEYGMDPLPDPRRRPGPLGDQLRAADAP